MTKKEIERRGHVVKARGSLEIEFDFWGCEVGKETEQARRLHYEAEQLLKDWKRVGADADTALCALSIAFTHIHGSGLKRVVKKKNVQR